jgi:hypothetical protein
VKLKWGDIQVATRGILTGKEWMDKRDICIVTNIHHPIQEGNFCDEQGNVIKPEIMTDYIRHKGYVDKGERMPSGCSISHQM